jgi:hypothetical protein
VDAEAKVLYNRQYREDHRQQLVRYNQEYHATHPPSAGPRQTRGNNSLAAILRMLFGVVESVSATAAKVTVGNVNDISWEAVDVLLRLALAGTSSPGVMMVAVDGQRCVLYEALVLLSRREDLTRLNGVQDSEDVQTRRLQPGEEPVKLRPDEAPFYGVRRVHNRWVATASVSGPLSAHSGRHVVSIGTAATQEDAARMRDIYVLGLWIDKQLRHSPTLNYPLSTYHDIFQSEPDLTA